MIFYKAHVTTLTQGGLKAMEELKNLEEERRAADGSGVSRGRKQAAGSAECRKSPLSCGAEGGGQRRDVRVFDSEYLVAAADSDECGGVPEPVREHKSHGDRGACDPGDGGEYAGGSYLL